MNLLRSSGPSYVTGQKPMTPFLYLAPRTQANASDEAVLAIVPEELPQGVVTAGEGHAYRGAYEKGCREEEYTVMIVKPDAELLASMLEAVPDPSGSFQFTPTKVGEGLYVWDPIVLWQGPSPGSPAEG